VLASLTFLSPRGGLLALVALVPLAVLAVSTLRIERIARTLRLPPASRRAALVPAAIAAAACVFIGIAAAQPVWSSTERHRARTESQVFFVVDVSRSMAAAQGQSGSPRLARARAAVVRLRDAVPAVPAGIAGLTDRVLPYLFPTLDEQAFAATMARSVLIESPPPQQVSTNATSFDALASLARDGFFDRSASRRTCVLVTDGETRSYSPVAVVGALGGPRGCRLLVVRVGNPAERVFGADGSPEAAYAPDAAAADKTRSLAEAAGGEAFSEDDLAAAAAALGRAADVGPVGRQRTGASEVALAPYAAALGLAAVLLLLGLRLRRVRLHRILTEA
jgi:hypothetical protein